MKTVIIDDDELSIEVLKNYIEKLNSIELDRYFTDPVSAIEYLQKSSIDLIFLDVEMPFISGLDLIKSLNNPPCIILTTGSSEYALEAYNSNVVDYLTKPIAFDRFMKAVEKAQKTIPALSNSNTNFIDAFFVKVNTQLVRIEKKDILFVEADGDYVKIQTLLAKFLVNHTMKEIEEMLGNNFLRIHRSFIVSLDKIEKINGNQVVIEKTTIPVSLTYKETLMKQLKLL